MIQRIQSVYLFLVGVISIILFFIPVGEFTSSTIIFPVLLTDSFTQSAITRPSGLLYMAIINLFIILLSFITVFMFRKRVMQVKMATVILILLLAFIILLMIMSAPRTEGMEITGLVKTYKAGAFFPAISVILTMLAIRGIKKDEALVRSADRIR
jgi:hypothetical protein